MYKPFSKKETLFKQGHYSRGRHYLGKYGICLAQYKARPRKNKWKASIFWQIKYFMFSCGFHQNLLENWLTPSFGCILAVRPKKMFFRDTTFLFFKIKSWIFLTSVCKKNKISNRQPIEKLEIKIVWTRWTKSFSNRY